MTLMYARSSAISRQLCQSVSRQFTFFDSYPVVSGQIRTIHLAMPTTGHASPLALAVRQVRMMSRHITKSMRAWQAWQYGGPEQLQLSDTAGIPVVKSPDDVLVHVEAASVNPLDVRLLDGYGKSTMNAIRLVQNRGQQKSDFPLVVGRDFSGDVVAVGKSISSSELKIGDKVWGVVSPFSTLGSHAEYTLTQKSMVCRKPELLSATEAASFPYCAMTMWSAVCIAGGLSQRNAAGKRVLLLGGSGGIGVLALQLLSAWDAEVTVVCSHEAEALVTSLGADIVLDYNQDNFEDDLREVRGFDLIVNLVDGNQYDWTTQLLKKGTGAKFVTVNYPMLSNNDQFGLPVGLAKSLLDLSCKAVPSLFDGQFYRWAMFAPSLKALKTLDYLLQKDQLQPVIQQIYPFEEAPQAYEQVKTGKSHGKIVIDFETSADPLGVKND